MALCLHCVVLAVRTFQDRCDVVIFVMGRTYRSPGSARPGSGELIICARGPAERSPPRRAALTQTRIHFTGRSLPHRRTALIPSAPPSKTKVWRMPALAGTVTSSGLARGDQGVGVAVVVDHQQRAGLGQVDQAHGGVAVVLEAEGDGQLVARLGLEHFDLADLGEAGVVGDHLGAIGALGRLAAAGDASLTRRGGSCRSRWPRTPRPWPHPLTELPSSAATALPAARGRSSPNAAILAFIRPSSGGVGGSQTNSRQRPFQWRARRCAARCRTPVSDSPAMARPRAAMAMRPGRPAMRPPWIGYCKR